MIYDAWGNVINRTGSTDIDFQYVGSQGYYNDSESDLFYIRARYLNPNLARWLLEDSIGLLDGLNLFTYVNNNPVVYIDPEGDQKIHVRSKSISLNEALNPTKPVANCDSSDSYLMKDPLPPWTPNGKIGTIRAKLVEFAGGDCNHKDNIEYIVEIELTSDVGTPLGNQPQCNPTVRGLINWWATKPGAGAPNLLKHPLKGASCKIEPLRVVLRKKPKCHSAFLVFKCDIPCGCPDCQDVKGNVVLSSSNNVGKNRTFPINWTIDVTPIVGKNCKFEVPCKREFSNC